MVLLVGPWSLTRPFQHVLLCLAHTTDGCGYRVRWEAVGTFHRIEIDVHSVKYRKRGTIR